MAEKWYVVRTFSGHENKVKQLLEAELEDKLPELVTVNDIRADLHVHSTWSDGRMSIRQMVDAAVARGLEYIVI